MYPREPVLAQHVAAAIQAPGKVLTDPRGYNETLRGGQVCRGSLMMLSHADMNSSWPHSSYRRVAIELDREAVAMVIELGQGEVIPVNRMMSSWRV